MCPSCAAAAAAADDDDDDDDDDVDRWFSGLTRYFLTQADRGIESETGFERTHKDNAIGMYGIGAKEAVGQPAPVCSELRASGIASLLTARPDACRSFLPWVQVFFLADGVEVITKHREDRRWCNFSMSKVRAQRSTRFVLRYAN